MSAVYINSIRKDAAASADETTTVLQRNVPDQFVTEKPVAKLETEKIRERETPLQDAGMRADAQSPLSGAELGAFWERFGPGLVFYAQQWCKSCDDVVQESFVKLAQQSPRPGDPLAWMYEVVKNGAINAGVAESRRRKHERAAGSVKPDWFAANVLGEFSGVDVTSALQQLDDLQREIVVLHLWNKLTFEQIGTIINQSSTTAQRHYANAIVELKEILEK